MERSTLLRNAKVEHRKTKKVLHLIFILILIVAASQFFNWRVTIGPSAYFRNEVFSDVAKNSATGRIFSGEKVREFNRKDLEDVITKAKKSITNCTNWNVVTTIFGPTDAVRSAASVPGWCTVIVADKKTPTDYLRQAGLENNTNCYFFSIKDQEKWTNEPGAIGKFFAAIPYNHFGRKNLGYFFAIAHGAQLIFDFDDDIILGRDRSTNKSFPPLEDESIIKNARVVAVGQNTFNHHPLMGASAENSCARGFPLEKVMDNTTHGFVAYDDEDVQLNKVAVLQYCVNENPDVDAIHRLTKPLPVTFAEDATPLLVPAHTFALYNAQATVHTRQAMWAMFLPISIPGRTSDIWRGYFAQTLFHDLELNLMILPATVTKDRNEHDIYDILGDMDADLNLNRKAGKLIDFLSGWNSASTSVNERMVDLWVDLYEHGYIEQQDVIVLNLWLHALMEVEYEFPTMKPRSPKVLIMGQFNYPSSLNDVIFWTQKWRENFHHVQARGPWSEEELLQLQINGLEVYGGRADEGWVSPIENLMRTVQDNLDSLDSFDGFMYVHDDALFDIPMLMNDINKDNFIATSDEPKEFAYRLHANGSFWKPDGYNASSQDIFAMYGTWQWFPICLEGYQKVVKDPRIQPYLNDDGSLEVPKPAQADFLYVPSSKSREFVQFAAIMADNDVFIECGIPTMLHFFTRKDKTGLKKASLCTNWNTTFRGEPQMLDICDRVQKHHMFHPLKINRTGYKLWSTKFDKYAKNTD